jgi:hypothetical protein
MTKFLKAWIVLFVLTFLPLASCTLISSTEPSQEAVEESAPASEPQQSPDPFGEAVNSAMAAATAAQTAKTSEEWGKVVTLWTEAIRLMKEVPTESESYETAQKKAVEYQPNLEYANKMKASIDNQPKFDGKVSADTFKGEWPFTVASGEVKCVQLGGQQALTFYTEATGLTYGLNGTADAMLQKSEGKIPNLYDIWLYDPALKSVFEAQGAVEKTPRISIKDIQDLARSLCPK